MDAKKLKPLLSAVVGQICIFIFLQKFVYGYTLRTHELSVFAGIYAYDAFIVFPCVLLVCLVLRAAASAPWGEALTSRRGVAVCAAVETPVAAAFLFGSSWLAAPAFQLTFTVLICGAFSVILFAWAAKFADLARASGWQAVLLTSLAAFLVYLVIAPSYANGSAYVLVIELLCVPFAALAYIACGVVADGGGARTALGGGAVGSAVPSRLGAAAVAFFSLLGTTYVDFLNEGLPLEHMEQPTFYALLLFMVVVLALGIGWHVGPDAPAERTTGLMVLGFGVLFAVSYLVIFYYAGSPGGFCFDFTCALRRLTIVCFYVLVLGVSLKGGFRVDVALGLFYMVPFLLARIALRSMYLQLEAGLMERTAGLKLGAMLVLGIVLVFSAAWYVFLLQRGAKPAPAAVEVAGPAGMSRKVAVDKLAERFSLSDREKDVLMYLSMGYSVSRVSEELVIAENTVGTHARAIYRKMGIHTKQDAIDMVQTAMGE